MRIDKLLWFLRLSPSRTLAHDWVAQGHFRINGRRVEKPSTLVNPGDVLTVPLQAGVQVIRLIEAPPRRGPSAEARECYHTLDERSANPIAAEEYNAPEGT
jgi:ribosome-associated heat shock protein Hsp15